MAEFVSKETMKRIISDIKTLRKEPLNTHGIYYEHDDTDMLLGRALIIGPADTPYADGFYLFKFKFPTNYPHEPPVVEFCTSDGRTRFNPNLYRSGKVCLSILNTWEGEQWSGCQTISTVLLALCTILNDTPLLNEPGVTKQHHDYANYNKIIAYKNYEIAIIEMLLRPPSDFATFQPIMREHFEREKEHIKAKLTSAAGTSSAGTSSAGTSSEGTGTGTSTGTITTGLYKMTFHIDYAQVLYNFNLV
jgi:ubiquitin-protein ligase